MKPQINVAKTLRIMYKANVKKICAISRSFVNFTRNNNGFQKNNVNYCEYYIKPKIVKK